MFKIRPILDQVILEDIPENEKSTGGLWLPKETSQKVLQGRVVAVGPGRKDSNGNVVPMQVAVGDKVCYEPYMAKTATVDGKVYWFVEERKITCVFE